METPDMMETFNLSPSQGESVGQRGDGGSSPGSHSPSRPMRQLEFTQAMSDFRHMFPETDEEVIEAVLRANSGMVDATIDQLLTMNIDAELGQEDEDDLPDHVLVSVEQDVLAQQQSQLHAGTAPRVRGESSKSSKKSQEAMLSCSKDSGEDCPPSYTEAVQSHLSHYRGASGNGGSSRRHKHSAAASSGVMAAGYNGNGNTAGMTGSNGVGTRTSTGHHHHLRMHRGGNANGMQHLLDLGPDSAPGASAAGSVGITSPPGGTGSPVASAQAGVGGHSSRSSRHHHHHHHHHHHGHSQRSSNHHRRRADNSESSPHKSSSSSRPGRNLLASLSSPSPSYTHQELPPEEFGYRPPRNRKGSFDSNDCSPDSRQEKSPQRWRPSRDSTSTKRPAFRNWNPPMLGTLPDTFLRIVPPESASTLGPSLPPSRPPKHSPGLHRTMSALGPERPPFLTAPSPGGSDRRHGALPDVSMTSSFRHADRPSHSHNLRPHRSLSFAGHSSQSQLQSSHRQPPHRRAPTTLHPAANLAPHEFSSDILQERMKENERRRHIAASSGIDPEVTQYLEDERLAIILQNSEFLQTLRGDRSFMLSLEQDHSGQSPEDTPTLTDGLPGETSTTSTFEPAGIDNVEVEVEGYGDDGRQTLEAFPFSKQLPPPANSEDMELRKKLKHMGKASKKQFAALARKFFSKRRKKNAHQILKESQAPSMMNLLDDEDEDDGIDDLSNGGGGGGGMPDSYNSNTNTSSNSLRNSWHERPARFLEDI